MKISCSAIIVYYNGYMVTSLFTNNYCLKHETPPYHPESVKRIDTILDLIKKPLFKELLKKKSKIGSIEDLLLVHDEKHIKKLFLENSFEETQIDQDTYFSKNSIDAVLGSIGAVKDAVDSVINKKIDNAFCAIRPPGHHASRNVSMGFCIVNNVAIGVKYAIKKYKLKKIAIIDFDVHHGNGTQNIFWDEKKVLFLSSHQIPLFPGTGNRKEVGKFGNIMNYELNPGTCGKEYIKLLSNYIVPEVKKFHPELIFLSSGFDAHEKDPLGNLNFKTDDFGKITEIIIKLAKEICNGRIISCLEGGYELKALSESIDIHLKKLMEA